MRITYFMIMSEVMRTYKECRQEGLGRDDTVAKLLEDYRNEVTVGQSDDGLLFWVALADAQYACRELSENVAAHGLASLNALANSDLEITPGDITRRKIRYQDAPMPERTVVRKTQKFRCRWKIGDTFAYQLLGPNAENAGIAGRYALLRKVDEKYWDEEGPVTPVITITLWDDGKLPENTQEFQRLPLMRLENGRLGSPETHFEYRAVLTAFSARAINKLNLLYLGNFADVPLPRNEVIFDYVGYMLMVSPTSLESCCSNRWVKQKRFNSVAQDVYDHLEPWQYSYSPL